MINFNRVCYYSFTNKFLLFLFLIDSQYRQITNIEDGLIAGFLYLSNIQTVINVLKDYFNSCYHVSIIFCGEIKI